MIIDRASEIKFVGLWDTVSPYGLPVESMTRAISKWHWPLDLPNRELPEIVDRACHALSLDDERRTFHPILWNERNDPSKPVRAANARFRMSELVRCGLPGHTRTSEVATPTIH